MTGILDIACKHFAEQNRVVDSNENIVSDLDLINNQFAMWLDEIGLKYALLEDNFEWRVDLDAENDRYVILLSENFKFHRYIVIDYSDDLFYHNDILLDYNTFLNIINKYFNGISCH